MARHKWLHCATCVTVIRFIITGRLKYFSNISYLALCLQPPAKIHSFINLQFQTFRRLEEDKNTLTMRSIAQGGTNHLVGDVTNLGDTPVKYEGLL